MEEITEFHSKLSCVMEKLLVAAVTEIRQLVSDHCAVIRVELSRQRQDNSLLRDQIKLLRPLNGFIQDRQDGHSGAGAQLQAEESAKEPEEGTSAFTDCKFEQVTVKHEGSPEDDPELRVPPVQSPACSPSRDATPQQEDATSCSKPPEGSKNPCTDRKQAVETRCQLSISSSGDQFIDLGFHIKQESESAGEDLSFELQQGSLCEMFSDSGEFPVDDTLPETSTLSCFSSSDSQENQHISGILDVSDLALNGQHTADRGAASHRENQFESGSTSCDIGAFEASQGSMHHKYTCDYCGKGFPFLSMMKGHRLSHTGERTQVCGHCGKKFIRRSHLTRHELLHFGVRPFTCQICGRKFSRRAHLSGHMKTHSR